MSPGAPPDPRGRRRADQTERTARRERRERALRRRRVLVATLLAITVAAVALVVARSGVVARGTRRHAAHASHTHTHTGSSSHAFAVGIRMLDLVDRSRTVELPTGPAPRALLTYVRYPASGASTRTDVSDAPAAGAGGPYPLIVFGHGYAVTPAIYARLLQAWAAAGYVVAAPVFPLENADAPGGPDESDLSNQPGDMQFVISELLRLSAAPSGPLAGLIDPERIAVAGHSDGGDTALALAYDSNFRDTRVKAAVILSGAELPGVAGFSFAPGEPPLLATQGTADIVNKPSETNMFFEAASSPKYRLDLLGAGHLSPYSHQEPQLGIVERVTIAFLDAYIKGRTQALPALRADGNVRGSARILADP